MKDINNYINESSGNYPGQEAIEVSEQGKYGYMYYDPNSGIVSTYCMDDWKELVDTIMIDWNYDGVTFNPDEKNGTDIPDRNELVKGIYKIPENSGTIHIKITDLISESWEGTYNINGDKL